MSMGRSLPMRPISTYVLIGIVLIGGFIFLSSEKEDLGPPLQVRGNIRQQLLKTHNHPLLERQQSLTNRPIRQENLLVRSKISLLSPLQQADINQTIPAFTGTLDIEQTVWMQENVGSGTLTVNGNFMLNPATKITSGSNFSGAVITTTVYFSGTLNFLRSGSTTRWHLDTISLSQSGEELDFLVIARAFLKEYEGTRIQQDNASHSIQEIQTFSLYEKLTHQIDQHLITTNSGSTQLLIDGPDRGIDAQIDSSGVVSAQLRFPSIGMRTLIQEQAKKNMYTFGVTHYLVPPPLLNGEISFIPTRTALTSKGTRTGSLKNQLNYSGSHMFSITPRLHFTVTPPAQTRSWEAIIALWNENEVNGGTK